MKVSDLTRSGHWPTLLTAFLYFDFSFMVWTVLGPLEAGGIQWPLPDGGALGAMPEDRSNDAMTVSFAQERRLFEDGAFYHADGKAKFLFEIPREVPEPTDFDYPFVLLTGRGTSSQWHTQTRTGKSAVLRKLYPDQIMSR